MSEALIEMSSQKQKPCPKRRQKLIGICSVCGDKSSSHLHYGSKVCFSCRAFFRRLVRNCTIPDKSLCNNLSIEGIGQCPINRKTRQLCRFCRYQKCSLVGMDAQLVMSKDEIVEKQVKATNIKKARKASGRLPPTSYGLKVKSCKKNAQKDLTKVIELSDTVSKSNHVSSSNFLENQDNKEYEELLLAAEDPDILIDFICSEDNNTEMIELSELYNVSPNDYTLEDQKTDDNEEYKDFNDLLLAADRYLK